MLFPKWLRVFGDVKYRGRCPSESIEQTTFFGWIRDEYPTSYGRIALHVRNEGKRTHLESMRQKAEGLTAGAPDIIIPPGFLCELKREDHTKSQWQNGQLEYLESAHDAGAYVCVALGYKAAIHAFLEYKKKPGINRV